mmetsp:Transcript_27750/g.58627  ORF Transcript_27750/g.58627 Transcript_27750/m.58627 type:complete len:117 (-) Transcript_27750:216-566(-)
MDTGHFQLGVPHLHASARYLQQYEYKGIYSQRHKWMNENNVHRNIPWLCDRFQNCLVGAFLIHNGQIHCQGTKGSPIPEDSQPMDWCVWSLCMGDSIARYYRGKFLLGNRIDMSKD